MPDSGDGVGVHSYDNRKWLEEGRARQPVLDHETFEVFEEARAEQSNYDRARARRALLAWPDLYTTFKSNPMTFLPPLLFAFVPIYTLFLFVGLLVSHSVDALSHIICQISLSYCLSVVFLLAAMTLLLCAYNDIRDIRCKLLEFAMVTSTPQSSVQEARIDAWLFFKTFMFKVVCAIPSKIFCCFYFVLFILCLSGETAPCLPYTTCVYIFLGSMAHLGVSTYCAWVLCLLSCIGVYLCVSADTIVRFSLSVVRFTRLSYWRSSF